MKCCRVTRGHYVGKKGVQGFRLVKGGLLEQLAFELRHLIHLRLYFQKRLISLLA